MLRFSLSFVIWLLVVFAALFSIFNLRQRKWDEHLLPFVAPQVPELFISIQQKTQQTPADCICIHPSLYNSPKWKDAASFFQGCYRRGWEYSRSQFFEANETETQSSIDAPTLEELPTDHWSIEHFEYSFRNGRIACLRQIDELLKTLNDSELRAKIRRDNRPGQAVLFFVVLIGVWKIYVALAKTK